VPIHHAAGDVLTAGVGTSLSSRALIAERTKAGLTAARRGGRAGGNPRLRAGDPDAIRKIRARRDAAHLAGILTRLDSWPPIVRRMRPDQPSGDVVAGPEPRP
jgi:hypothetical protein